ncbi:alpha/beta hydrolase-fold protein [Caulobacter sp. UNC279MFTsu5.1]|uniref:alpha/beta hydrolase-fold protein n=1 Tax=Caulobacter sp. UNC279MFTsu5.1 TaxID=1502775 RepID=UPI0008E1864B|nr:alpha/beta hydrolase-fold protein [Caulobacter sp. UNC279MFTsu5.1]SFK18523.1 Putative esterase [Caulobacter sp. UNC279MFTsu5.1]
MIRLGLLLAAFMTLLAAPPALAQSQVRDFVVASKAFDGNKIGVSPQRRVRVYLPDGYDASGRRYPVIYYLHNLFEDERPAFDRDGFAALLDQAIAAKAIPPVIVVAADFSTPLGGSIYTSSPVTGRWDAFMADELVPWTDKQFRTLAGRDSRGLAGDRMGGYGALAFGMRHADVFGSVYALHPVGTGLGLQTMSSRPNWDLIQNARSLDDLKADGFSQLFVAIYQAHLPNPDRPPLYVDLPARKEADGRMVVDMKRTAKLQDSFLLGLNLPRYADNLKTLRGLKFDWGRNDPNPDHVVSNQAFSRALVEFGVPHEAEEYVGGWGDRTWGETGRVYSDMLPFFAQKLVYE